MGARLKVKAWTDPAFKKKATIEVHKAQESDKVCPGLDLGFKLPVRSGLTPLSKLNKAQVCSTATEAQARACMTQDVNAMGSAQNHAGLCTT